MLECVESMQISEILNLAFEKCIFFSNVETGDFEIIIKLFQIRFCEVCRLELNYLETVLTIILVSISIENLGSIYIYTISSHIKVGTIYKYDQDFSTVHYK